jgi:hypothetical protein
MCGRRLTPARRSVFGWIGLGLAIVVGLAALWLLVGILYIVTHS